MMGNKDKVTSYYASPGILAFVYSPPEGEEKYYTVLQYEQNRSVMKRLTRRLLPVRQTREEAETDLKYYAWLKKWKPAH